MIADLPTTGPPCTRWQQAIDAEFDGAAPRLPGVSAPLDDHLHRCPHCRAYERDLHRLRAALRTLPEVPLPDGTLDEIWAATVDRAPRPRRVSATERATVRVRRGLAAAAAIALAAIACVAGSGRARATDLDRIERDLHVVMATIADTLARTERVAVEDVLAGETTTALRYLPLGQTTEQR